jgi:hypothetical protein
MNVCIIKLDGEEVSRFLSAGMTEEEKQQNIRETAEEFEVSEDRIEVTFE